MASTRALINATKRGDKDGVLRCLQRGAEIEGTDEESRTPLYLAIRYNHADVAITLLEKGANPNWRPNLEVSTSLMRAISQDLTNVASLLIEKGARVNDCDISGYTALMFTPERGHEDIALKLIKHGAQVNARENQNYTPLHWASVLNSPAVLRVLLANGADINAINDLGETALDIAKKERYSEIEAILKAHGQDIGTFREMRQLIETLQSRIVGMEESRRVNDERLAGRINELENEKNVMKRMFKLTELKTRFELNLIKKNQIELEARMEKLRVELDEMKRDNLLKEEKLNQLKNATEALILNRIKDLPDSSRISDGWADLFRLTTRSSEYLDKNGEEEIEQQQSHGESKEFEEQMEQLLVNQVGGYDRNCQNQRTSQRGFKRPVGFSNSSVGFAHTNGPRSSLETVRVRSGNREEIEGHFRQISESRYGPKPGERRQGQEVNRDRGVRSRRAVPRRQGLRQPAQGPRWLIL